MESEYTPEEIAEALFNQPPKEPFKYQILVGSQGTDQTLIFEILLTILLEGLNILSNGLNNFNLDDFNENYIYNLIPWFNSIGFDIKVNINSDISNYYCRILINNKSHEYLFFNIKNLIKNYHFLLNGNFISNNNELSNIYAIFKFKNKSYSIFFNYLN